MQRRTAQAAPLVRFPSTNVDRRALRQRGKQDQRLSCEKAVAERDRPTLFSL